MNFSYNILAIYLLYLYFINIFLPSVYIIFPILIISKKHIYCKIIYVFVFYHLYTYLFVNNKKDSVNRVNERTGIRTPDTRLRRALLYPAELCTHKMERETRFELATSTLARSRSTTELFPLIKMATWKGLEPSTSSVTGWHSNQLNYQAALYMVGVTGLEPVTPCL